MAKSYHQQVIQYLNDNYRCNLGVNDIEVGGKHPYVKFNYNGKTIRLTLNREETNRGLAFRLKQQDIRRMLGEPPIIIDSFTKLEEVQKKEVMETALKTIDSLGHIPEHIESVIVPNVEIPLGIENVDFNGVNIMNTSTEVVVEAEVSENLGKVYVAQYGGGGPRFLISEKTAAMFFPSGKISFKRLGKYKFECKDSPSSSEVLKATSNTRRGFFVYYSPRNDALSEPKYGMTEAKLTTKDNKILKVEVLQPNKLSKQGQRRIIPKPADPLNVNVPQEIAALPIPEGGRGILDYTDKMKSILEDLKFVEGNSPFRLVKTRTNDGEVWDWRVRF